MANPRLDRVLADDYLGDLASRPLEELRAMRIECQELEASQSYLRRLLQGRLDLAGAILTARRQGDELSASTLLTLLPQLLAGPPRPAGVGHPEALAVDLGPDAGDELAGEPGPESLLDLDVEGVTAAIDRLTALESEISGRRHKLHECIDALQAELSRRYKTGEASVETLRS
jgi:hypothetical protein